MRRLKRKAGRALNPNSEGRNPKKIRSPKRVCAAARHSDFGSRISFEPRISDFVWRRISNPAKSLQGFQILDQILLFPLAQSKPEKSVVVVDHVGKRREPPVVIKPALLVGPQSLQRRRAIAMVR